MPRLEARSRRWLSAAVLLFQVATLATWQALEAWQVNFPPNAHIEQAGGTGCPAPHDEALCRLCQFCARGQSVPTVRLPVINANTTLAAARPVVEPTGRPGLRVGNSRAPPFSLDRNSRPA